MRTILTIALLAASNGWAAAADWQPVPGNPLTPWAAKVDPKCPLAEYPRPQMVRGVRNEWQNLNGLWDCAVAPREAPQPGIRWVRLVSPKRVWKTATPFPCWTELRVSKAFPRRSPLPCR